MVALSMCQVAPGIFANHDAPSREKVALFLTLAIGTVTLVSFF
jgi:hypothetical protein